MSTLRVNTLQNTSTTDGGISINNSGHVTVDGVAMPSSGPLSNRNLIINGAMQVAQRGTSQSFAHDGTTNTYTLDRFLVNMANADQWDCTVTQSSDAPDGFANSLLVTTGTPETTIGADEYFSVQHKIEAQNLQHIDSGTSSAKALTLSFWVRSSQTGTFAFSIYKGDQTARGISATYTISSANTWEYKTIAISGDTGGGGIDNDNGNGWNLYWLLAAGSNWTSTDSTSWINYVTTGFAYGHTQNGVITTASATWQITGVQLEVGSVATPFEHRSFGDELARCLRYYYKIQGDTESDIFAIGYNEGSTTAIGVIDFKVTMRTSPTSVETSGTASDYRVRSITNNTCTAVPVYRGATNQNAGLIWTVASGLTNGYACQMRFFTANGFLAWSAEL